MTEPYRLSVVICAVDETFSLRNAYGKLRSAVDCGEFLFVLAQHCAGETREIVQEICQSENCRFFVQSGQGLGNAIREAIQAVAGTHMLVWPADDGMDTSSVPQMLRLSREDPEKIITISRWIEGGGFCGYGRVRKAVNFLSQKLFARLYHSDLTDFTNPTQIAPVSVYRAIRWQGNGFDLIPEMIFKPLRLGYGFEEVPCTDCKRVDGVKHNSFWDLAKYYVVILKIRFMHRSSMRIEGEEAS